MGWGDELMVTGHARELQARDPRKVRPVYEKSRWHEAWENNPRIAGKHEVGDFQEFRPRTGYLRPYIIGKSAAQWTWQAYQPPRGELYFTAAEAEFGAANAGHVIVEPHLKQGASPNKQWGWERWCELARLMLAGDLQPVQLGPAGTALLPGARFVHTRTMRLAASVMSRARVAVLPEGGLHHVCAAVGTPAVVIFGGFIAPAVTGYPEQKSFFRGEREYPLGCGMRVTCPHCAAAMAAIAPRDVLSALKEIL